MVTSWVLYLWYFILRWTGDDTEFNIVKKGLPRMQLKVLSQGTINKCILALISSSPTLSETVMLGLHMILDLASVDLIF